MNENQGPQKTRFVERKSQLSHQTISILQFQQSNALNQVMWKVVQEPSSV